MNKREIFAYCLYHFCKFFYKEEKFLSIYFHAPSPRLFEEIVKWCKGKGYRFIDINECYQILTNKIDIKEKVVYFSFDDGWKSNLNLLPIIEKYNVPITIFVATEPIESGNYWWEYASKSGGTSKVAQMKQLEHSEFIKELAILKRSITLQRSSITEEELAVLANHPLVSLQSHTVTHPILTNCSPETLDWELVESKKHLEKNIGKEVFAFSYPNGDVGDREVKAVENVGYKIAFTTKAQKIDTTSLDNIYLVPRKAINTNGGKYENLAKVLGVWQKTLSIFNKIR